MNLAKASGEVSNPEVRAALAVDSSLELYGVVLMLGICSIAIWEFARVCWRNRGEAVRLSAVQATGKSETIQEGDARAERAANARSKSTTNP